MNDLAYMIVAFALSGGEELSYILLHVRVEYFTEYVFREIFKAIQQLTSNGMGVDILSVREKLVADDNAIELSRRIDVFRSFFEHRGILSKGSPDERVKVQIRVFLAELASAVNYSIPVAATVACFLSEYVGKAKQKLLAEYQSLMANNPSVDYSEELFRKMKELDNILSNETWKQYLIDIPRIEGEPDEEAIIFRKGQGYFWRGNIYLVSGFAGSMKSYLCLCIAAAALNAGTCAYQTLSFHSISSRLKVLFADTELALNTVKKRIRTLKLMTCGKLDDSTFKYLSLTNVPGGKDAKLHVFDEACHRFRPDIIVLDSARDLCVDFNDNRESDSLVAHYKQIAIDLRAVLICTSHKTLGAGNAKGHFGVRLNEASGLEFSLAKVVEGDTTYVRVEFPKQREDTYAPFSFRYSPETEMLEEYAPTVERREQRRQKQKAEDAVRAVLSSGEKVRYNRLRERLKALGVSDGTAKNYMSVLSGELLVRDADGYYSLADVDAHLPLNDNDDLPQ